MMGFALTKLPQWIYGGTSLLYTSVLHSKDLHKRKLSGG